jgi:serine/threonine protein kinase
MTNTHEFGPGELISGTPYEVEHLLFRGASSVLYDVGHELVAKVYDGLRVPLTVLRHPNVVTLRDVVKTDERLSRWVIVMERLEGVSLDAALATKGRRLPLRPTLDIGIAVSSALSYLHAQGMTHGALAPDKLFVGRGSIERAPGVRLLLSTRWAHIDGGFPQYWSPECLDEGQSKDPIDPMDVFALGALLFELVTGRSAFLPLASAAEHLAQIKKGPPSLGIAVPESFDALVHTCMAYQAADRPTATELHAALRDVWERVPAAEDTAPLPRISARDLGEKSLRDLN